MHWKNVYGTYVPCYLLINLKQTDAELHSIRDIDERDQRVFFHEYTHFLQNIAGGFGHSHIWQTYDKLRQVISDLRKNEAAEISIPLKNTVTEQQELMEKVMETIEGSYSIRNGVDDNTAFVPNANLYLDESFQKLQQGKNVHFLNLQIEDDNGRRTNYSFGESAVSETMAYLMESKMFDEQNVANFPYKACQKVAAYLGSNLTYNKEWLFAMCDIAMLCNYPGMAFYTILLDMQHANFIPEQTEQIYEFGENAMKNRGWDIWGNFETNKNGAIHVIKELFRNPIFEETLNWLVYIIDEGFNYRKANPHFMLKLYQEASPFEGSWDDINKLFGTPQLHNAKDDRYFQATVSLKEKEKNIEPLFLLSLKQIQNTLYDGASKCDLLECCRKAKIGPEIDYRCVTEPWARSSDEKTCAYGAQWLLFGLANKKVV
jgi:hypothetical protein